MYEQMGEKGAFAYENKELSQYEKDECKILVSEYLNDSAKDKKIKAKNANQLFHIIDFLIEYINNKEKHYKEKMQESYHDYKDLFEYFDQLQSLIFQIKKIINQKNLNQYFTAVNIDELLEKFKRKNKDWKSVYSNILSGLLFY